MLVLVVGNNIAGETDSKDNLPEGCTMKKPRKQRTLRTIQKSRKTANAKIITEPNNLVYNNGE